MTEMQLMGLEFLGLMGGFAIAIAIVGAVVKKPVHRANGTQATRNTTRSQSK